MGIYAPKAAAINASFMGRKKVAMEKHGAKLHYTVLVDDEFLIHGVEG